MSEATRGLRPDSPEYGELVNPRSGTDRKSAWVTRACGQGPECGPQTLGGRRSPHLLAALRSRLPGASWMPGFQSGPSRVGADPRLTPSVLALWTDALNCPSRCSWLGSGTRHTSHSAAPFQSQGSEPRASLASRTVGWASRSLCRGVSWCATALCACSLPDRPDCLHGHLTEAGLQGPEGNRRRQPPIFPDPVNGAVQSRRAGGRFLVLQVPPGPPALWEVSAGLPSLPPSESRSFRPSFWGLCLGCGFPTGQRLLDVSVQCESPPRSWARPCPLSCLESPALFWPMCLSRAWNFFQN